MQEFKSQKIKAVIKDLLKKKSITYDDLAEQMECSVPTIKRILGAEELTLNRLLQLCEIVDIDLAELETLTNASTEKEESFTDAQQVFLSKNRSFLAYLMKLFDGKTPKQIAEENNLTARSTDKYLIGLEKQELIHVTGKQKVKPNFKRLPTFGGGPLAKLYFNAFVRSSSDFFAERLQVAINQTEDEKKSHKHMATFSTVSFKISKASYVAFAQAQEKALRDLENLSIFEEKSKHDNDLMTTVITQAHTILPNEDPSLKIFNNPLGPITNL
jgi:transcriptional regulator with XRE-family HTH domain